MITDYLEVFMTTNNTKDDVTKFYTQVTDSADQVLDELKKINAKNDDDLQDKISLFINNIDKKKGEFKALVDELETNSEFDKFTIAFFGQTGAGKSTIIEALRILFDEESRKKQIQQNASDFASFEKEYQKKIDNLISELRKIKSGCRNGITIYVLPLLSLIIGILLGYTIHGAF